MDDVHPARSTDLYEAGGDLGAGTLGRVERLLERHPLLKATLFVTPDWRPKRLVARGWRTRVPLVSSRVYHVDRHAHAPFRLDRHPEFVRYLNALPRTECAPHGLHHVHRGPRLAVEFQGEGVRWCRRRVRAALEIFAASGLNHARGFAPPGWNLPAALVAALAELDFTFVSSARDVRTPIHAAALAAMSGLHGVPLTRPAALPGTRLQHIPVNFQATSSPERAHQIIACGGLVSIKAHAFKHGGGHTMADGLDSEYFAFLDRLLQDLERRYGDSIWWASFGDLGAASRAAAEGDATIPPAA
ncbi:MAG TPA: DUF2334 domain-containing protein [Gammaproteobacteria bacterium]|nr:DUF2334 domain-containing protein [Gammaproteobacteria bacterium]